MNLKKNGKISLGLNSNIHKFRILKKSQLLILCVSPSLPFYFEAVGVGDFS